MPHGRGVLKDNEKLILGYLENGDWADDSERVIVYWRKHNWMKEWSEGDIGMFKVHRVKREADGSLVEVGKIY